MNKVLLLVLFVFSLFNTQAQFFLKPLIGSNTEANDNNPICIIPNYLGSFTTSGYHVGDTVNDFTLFDLEHRAYSLSEMLADGKPVVLISSSYTCPVFRGKVQEINEVFKKYNDKVNILIVYTVEAHPDIDISPYFGKVHTGGTNIAEGILFRQPIAFIDRKKIAAEMLSKIEILPKLIIDGPCNEWWAHYGPAPNNATIIQPNGQVFAKHDWLNRLPNDLACDLEKLLNGVKDCNVQSNGSFTHEITSDTMIKGTAGEILYARGVLRNNTNSRVNIKAVRLKKNIPSAWETSMCLDICYGPDVDTAYFYINPGQSISYYIDFFTDPVPGVGSFRLGFVNSDDNTNKASVNYTLSTILSDIKSTDEIDNLPYLYPNPSKEAVNLSIYSSDESSATIKAILMNGKDFSFETNIHVGKNIIPLTFFNQ
ncbi:MAG: hypothetical protein ABIO44_07840, partial [Saprospiraceae bacterium]